MPPFKHPLLFPLLAIVLSLLLKLSPISTYLTTIMSQTQTTTQTSPELSQEETAKTSPKFAPFTILSTPYKTISSQPIPVHLLIPKSLSTTPSTPPILVRFHGGFLITGAALFPDFTAQWALDYCLSHNAIWIAPDYRLLPESSGLDILSDLSDFWIWLQHSLTPYLHSSGYSHLKPDLNKVITYGESAGGYLAVQSALTQPDIVKAVIAAFPMLEVDAPWYSTKSAGKSPFGAPEVSKTFLEKHISSTPSGEICTAGYPPDRVPLALVAIQQGIFTEMLGTDEKLFPLRVLEKVRGDETLPFLFTFHGMQDRAVPWEGTRRFADIWGEKFGEGSLVAHFGEGDHGFGDKDPLGSEWLQRGLEGVTRAWL